MSINLPMIASIGVAIACYYTVWFVSGIIVESRAISRSQAGAQDYGTRQINKIRESSFIFRNFETLARAIAKSLEKSPENENREHYLDLKGMVPPWSASLFQAVKIIEAIAVAIGATVVLSFWLGAYGLILGPCVAIGIYYAVLSSLKSEALEIKKQIVRKLPFVVDLMALVRLANGSFNESLEIVAKENDDHPIGKVFERARADAQFGITQRNVLDNLSQRMRDPAFDEICFAISKADELGRPVATTLSELASQMRLKRQQWGEATSGQAQVKIMYPGLVIMLACLLVIVAPFILQALYANK